MLENSSLESTVVKGKEELSYLIQCEKEGWTTHMKECW